MYLSVISPILDVFDRYNFTVCEDEPLEKEVAIDPEMLGKIFENTIADNERKGKGAFYTPRPIVHYMVKQSLCEYLIAKLDIINTSFNPNQSIEPVTITDIEILVNYAEFYLENEAITIQKGKETNSYTHKLPKAIINNALILDNLLASISILDPAVGSGAFPVGLLIELVKIRQVLAVYTQINKSAYQLKYHAITHSIYGVDIDSGAIDVARLRLWLSLIVDEDDFAKIKPLPNLDYKLIVGNSLMQIDNVDMFIDADMQQLQTLEDKFAITTSPSGKKELKNQIDMLLDKVMQGNFDFRYIFGKYRQDDGFDIVIGNPPYVGEKGNRYIFQEIKQSTLGKLYYQGKMDLFYFFFHLAIDVAKPLGNINFITTNYYITADGAVKLRTDFKNRTNVLHLINFNEVKLFESALGQHNIITILQKQNNIDIPSTNIVKIKNFKNNLNANIGNIELSQLFKHSEFVEDIHKPQIDIFEGKQNYIRVSNNSLYTKITINTDKLEHICNVNQGIVTGIDKISQQHIKKYPNENYTKNQGVFILDNASNFYDDIPLKERDVLVPFYKNSDIKQYTTAHDTTESLLYLDKDVRISSYPTIEKHLLPFKPILISRREFSGGARPWFLLHWARSKEIFTKPKIVATQRSSINTFAYNEIPWFASADVYFITCKNNILTDDAKIKLKYITALLNSKLFYYWFYNFGKRKGNSLELYATPLSEAPIYRATFSQMQPLITLVDEIIHLKAGGGTDTAHLQQQIDALVYELYQLTPDEIAIIEAK